MKLKKINTLLILICLLCCGRIGQAAQRFWSSGSSTSFTNTANWSGSGSFLSTDTLIFDGGHSNVNCTLDGSGISIKKLQINSNYTGTVNLSTFSITIGGGGFSIAGGTINLSSSTVTVSGNWTYTGGTVTKGSSTVNFSTSGSLVVTVSGSHSLGKVMMTNSSVSASVTIASGTTLTVDSLIMNGSDLMAINTGTVNVNGNMRIQTSTINGGGGSGTICLSGSSDQNVIGVSSPGSLCNVSVNKGGGDVIISNKISVKSLSLLDGTANYRLMSGSIAGVINNGQGNVTMSSGCHANGGTATIYINGSAITQTVSASGVGKLPAVTIDVSAGGGGARMSNPQNGGNAPGIEKSGPGKSGPNAKGYFSPMVTGGIVVISGTVAVGNDWTYKQGTLTVTSSKVIFDPAYKMRIIGSHTLNKVAFNNSNGSSNQDSIIVRSGTTLTVSDSLIFSGNGPILVDSAGQISATSHIKITNTASGGGGSGSLVINGTGSQTLTGSGSTSGLGLCNVTVNKSAGTLSLSSLICFGSNLTYTAGTVSAGTSTVALIGTGSVVTFTPTLYGLTFAPTSASTHTITSGTALTATGTVTYAGTAALTINSGTINAQGDIAVTNTATVGGGTTLLHINGTVTQNFTGVSSGLGLPLGDIKINKSGTLNLSNTINAGGAWTYSVGTVAPGSSTVALTATTQTVTGTHTLNAVRFYPTAASTVTIASGTALTATGTVIYDGTAALTVNTGTLNAQGNISVTNTVTSGGGNAIMNVNSASSQTVTGTSSSTAAPFPHFIVNKGGGTLTINGTSLAASGSVTCTSGTYTTSTSNTFYLYGSFPINSPNITFNHVNVSSGTRTLTGNLTTAGDVIISSSTTLDASGTANKITVKGNWSNSGAFKSGTGYVTFTGTNTQTITQPTSATDSIAKLEVNKSSGTLTINTNVAVSDSVKFTSGNISTGTNDTLIFWRRAKYTGVSSSSFVAGPVKKIGNSTFTFPIGKGSDYQPLSLNTAPSVVTDAFAAEYFNTGQTQGSATDTTIGSLSTCEYWNYLRKNGTSTVKIALGWNASSCNGDSATRMQLAYWNSGSSKWNNIAASASGTVTSGTLTTSSAVSTFGFYTLAKKCVISSSISASPSATVCTNGTATLTDNASSNVSISSYTWTPSSFLSATTGSVVTVSSPTANTTYTCIATNAWGCPSKRTISISVISPPTLTVSPATTATVCSGTAATFTASGASTYTWNPGSVTGSTVALTPTVTTNYTVTGTATNGCTNTKTLTVTVNSLPPLTVSASATLVCAGTSVSLIGSNALTYTWSGGTSPSTGSMVTATPTVTTTYTVSGTGSNSCVATKTITITVNPLPSLTITPSSATICSGSSTSFTASGASSYTWNPGSVTTSTITVTPSSTTVYTLTGKDGNNCVNTKTTTVTVNTTPTVSVNSAGICSGNSAVLSTTVTPSGSYTYSWTPSSTLSSSTTASVTATPTITTGYTVTATSGAGCSSSTSTTVTVLSTPTVSVNSATICVGSSAVLTSTVAGGADSYSWTPSSTLSSSTTASVTATPTTTTVYTLTVIHSSIPFTCSGTATSTVTVNALPTVSISPSSATICTGSSTTFTASGASTYSWSPSAGLSSTTSASVTANPTVTTTYTVTGTDANGCVNTKTITVTVNSLPTISISPSSATICAGGRTTFTASGASTYTWAPFIGDQTNSATPVIGGTVTATYTVTGTDANGCVNSNTVTLNVNPLPTLTITPSSATICTGTSTSFTASGASTYTWNPGSVTGSTITVTPTVTTTYTLSGTDGNGCIGKGTVTVTVNPLPTLTISPSSAAICIGSSTSFTASGASTYTWNPGSVTGSTITVTPTVTTTYTLSGTDANSCVNTNTVTVTVNPLPTITITPSPASLCTGYNATLTASGASTYSWSPASGLSSTSGTSVTANPSVTTTYTITGTDANGCINTNTVIVNVNPTPTVSLPTNAGNHVCSGYSLPYSVTVTPTGSYTYSWTPGTFLSSTSSGSVVITPTVSITYTLLISSGAGCTATVFPHITMDATPTVTVSSETICVGASADLTTTVRPTSSLSYSWSPSSTLSSSTTSSVVASPTVTTTYTLVVSRPGLEHIITCYDTVTSTVTVHPCVDACYCISSFAPIPGKKYLISAWARENGATGATTTFTNPAIYLDFDDASSTLISTAGPYTPSGTIIDGWQRIESIFTVPSNALILTIRLESNSGDVLFDDIRVFPYDGSAKSYVYDPVTLRLVAELDERNYATKYEYDEEGKLIRIKKETERGVMTIKESRNNSPKQ